MATPNMSLNWITDEEPLPLQFGTRPAMMVGKKMKPAAEVRAHLRRAPAPLILFDVENLGRIMACSATAVTHRIRKLASNSTFKVMAYRWEGGGGRARHHYALDIVLGCLKNTNLNHNAFISQWVSQTALTVLGESVAPKGEEPLEVTSDEVEEFKRDLAIIAPIDPHGTEIAKLKKRLSQLELKIDQIFSFVKERAEATRRRL